MSAYIAPARRAFLMAVIATVAACSSSDGTAPTGTPPAGQPPVGQPNDTTSTPARSVASIRLAGDREVVHTYMGWLEAQPLDQAGQPIAATVTWRSSDTTIVKVDAVGAMIGRGAGKAIVSAQASGKLAEIEVTVVPRRVMRFERTPVPATLQRGDVGYFGTVALDQRGQVILYPQLAFTSADPSIVEVNAQGHLIARRGGEARVTATADGVSTSHVITVANETTYPIKYANGNALPWVIFEQVTQEGAVRLTTRLVMTDASFTLSNVGETWSQRTVVDEYRIEETDGTRIVRKVGTDVSTSGGAFTTDPATGRLQLTVNGDPAARLEAWYEDGNVRKLRVYAQPANGQNAFLNDYQR
jgi:hypothetical protein